MTKDEQLAFLLERKLVAVVRSADSAKLTAVSEALLEGGIAAVEITMTVPDALEVVRAVRQRLGEKLLLGAGTILDAETARAALLAGADFLVAPVLDRASIALARRYSKLVMPGAFTPTEILRAWEAGADIVKVFPADLGGPSYLKAIAGPLPQVRLMPTGGVDRNTAADFLRAGACCLGLGSALVDKEAIARGDFDRIRSLAEQYVAIVREFNDR